MKNNIILAISLLFCVTIQAQKLNSSDISNGVLKISTTDFKLNLSHDFNLSLDKLTDGTKVQYYIKGVSEKNESHSFPENAKLLFKLTDGSIVELTSYYSFINYIEDNNDYYPTAYYPISEEQLNSLFNGVSKVRVELLSVDKDDVIFQDLQDVDYKKDKLGKVFKAMYDVIAEEEKHLESMAEKGSKVKDASSGF